MLPPTARVEVATEATVLTPVAYTTAPPAVRDEEVDKPEKDSASPVRAIGKAAVRLVSLEISIDVPRSAVTFPLRYVRPPEYVVVAPLYTRPLEFTANPPADRDGSLKLELIVEEAVEKNPFRNPRVVDVALYEGKEVNGKAATEVRNPASLLNQESLIDDDAIV